MTSGEGGSSGELTLPVLRIMGTVSGLAVVGVSLGESRMAKDSSGTRRRGEEVI